MDKSVLAGGVLCFIADLFAIASLAMPEWVISKFSAGSMRLGLAVSCQQPRSQPEVCITTDQPGEWVATTGFMVVGIVLLTMAWFFLLFSTCERQFIVVGRWIIFFALALFNLAAIVFPLGFHMPEIGGVPFKLPNGTSVGPSFIMFIFCIIMTVASELFLFKICPLLLRNA
ncbi:uncharacterized protein C16orf52 homolog A-like [Actinia tenebrosa]|uniref:Uncharacterized protein C16orf52 homolog A-like n=1 Tax=Actinia tenebrosa TaxID=6105 RepID=A0A6P8HGV6_ACTTE|nr:uncharacterized protein C16orf52 homolog A-like [Actinia tenebrosa]